MDGDGLASTCRSGLVSLRGAHDAQSMVRSCRAAREIQHPHGEYVGRAATVLARYEPPGTSREIGVMAHDCRTVDYDPVGPAVRGSRG
jgi:hypothetical protein